MRLPSSLSHLGPYNIASDQITDNNVRINVVNRDDIITYNLKADYKYSCIRNKKGNLFYISSVKILIVTFVITNILTYKKNL